MDQDLKKKLSPLAWKVTQQQGTEAPFSGEFNLTDDAGDYHCICCGNYLFSAEQKFASSCGWPAFFDSIENAIEERPDDSHGMQRIEVVCNQCSAHLGHKFADGPHGTRYCINSVSLDFKPNREPQ